MTGERGRTVTLYLTAALILLAGTLWWWRAAPGQPVDPQLQQWRRSAEQLLPDDGEQELADTVAVSGTGFERAVPLAGAGMFLVSVVCAGRDGARARIRLGDDEWERPVACSGDRVPQVFRVLLSGDLRMRALVDGADTVVLRYSVQRMS